MTISVKELFGRQGISGEVISVRNSLANHPDGIKMSLREAYRRLLEPADGNGFARGCRRPDTLTIGIPKLFTIKDVGLVLPEWVPVAGNTTLVEDHRGGGTQFQFREDFTGETRTLEGILVKSHVTETDFPLRPWHTYYDWNYHVRVDRQYTYLNSPYNMVKDDGVIECEWDTALLPDWAWPQDGSRVWIVGRWIYDCGHPEAIGHKSEIHPPKAVVSFRSEAVQFDGNQGPVRANQAVVFIGREGGYWRQPINDQNYAFDLYLPPKPYEEAVPVLKTESQTGALPVQPQFTPFPAAAPRALRVVIPLKGVEPHPENYGIIISAGWSDPRGTESAAVRHVRVTVEEILMDANLDPDPFDTDEWYVYVGVNGRWKVFENLGGESHKLNYAVELSLHASDQVHVTCGGREADEVNSLMGHATGLSWADISAHDRGEENAKAVRSGFLSLGSSLDPSIENESIGMLSQFHVPQALSTVTVGSSEGKYRLRYRIEEV
jgi:hypothetical protein